MNIVNAEYILLKESQLDKLIAIKDEEELSDTLLSLEESNQVEIDTIGRNWDLLHFYFTGKSASDPLEFSPLSSAVLGQTNFFEDDESEFITYTSNKLIPEILEALEKFDYNSRDDWFKVEMLKENEIYPESYWGDDSVLILQAIQIAARTLIKIYKKALEHNLSIVVSILD